MAILGMKRMYAGADLEIDDLFLLESFQIAYLPGWVPEREFAAVLIARPEIRRYLVTRCPEVADFVDSVMERHGDAVEEGELTNCGDALVWTIADLLVYNKCPEIYDRLPFHDWDFAEVTGHCDLAGKCVIDAGSGTGRVAIEAAETAGIVFAVEPVGRLRQYIREKAEARGLTNLYVTDGFLHALPFPESFADVVITSHALGWQLQDELEEFERVVKHPGIIIHCPGTAAGSEGDTHRVLVGSPWSYECSEYDEADGRKRKYWKWV